MGRLELNDEARSDFKEFQATRVWPMDAEVILKRFSNRTLRQDEALKLGQQGDGDT